MGKLGRIFMVMGVVFAALSAVAGPAEIPPPGYPGVQYIDSTGCVYALSNGEWVARRDEAGEGICGFPPSITSPEKASEGASSVERELTEAIVTSGFMARLPDAAEAPSEEHSRPPEVIDKSLNGKISRAIAVAPKVTITPRHDWPVRRLCALIGMELREGKAPLGADPTGGLCAEGAAQLPQETRRVAHAAIAPTPSRESPEVKVANPATAMLSRIPKSIQRPQNAKTNHSAKARNSAPRHKRDDATPVPNEVIPPGARYVHIGAFPDAAASAAIERVRRLGYPALRGKSLGADGTRLVLAGPFDSRERLVSALSRIRRAGLTTAVAR